MKKKIIGIIGGVGSGKDTVAEYISKKIGVQSFQISQPLKDIAKERNIEPSRENLIQIGSDLVKEKGAGFLAELCLEKISGNTGIITGIRVLEVIEYLRENSDFILLAVNAEPEVRFKRTINRGKLGEADTLEDFIKREEMENSPPNAQRLFECLKLVDYEIINDRDINSLQKEVDLFLEKNNLLN